MEGWREKHNAMVNYEIDGVPKGFLIDTEGYIGIIILKFLYKFNKHL